MTTIADHRSMTFDHMMLTRLRVFTCSHYVIPQFVVAVLMQDPVIPHIPRVALADGRHDGNFTVVVVYGIRPMIDWSILRREGPLT